MTWAIMMASLVALGSIETTALFHSPLKPDSIHTRALEVKGGLRYVTDEEYELHSIAMPSMMTSFLASAALSLWWTKVKRRDDKLELEKTFRHFDSWHHGN